MSIEIELSSIFAPYTGNQRVIQAQGSTVGEGVNDLIKQFPKLKRILLDNKGQLHRSFDVYVNGESAYPQRQDKPIKDGDKINIVYLIQGG